MRVGLVVMVLLILMLGLSFWKAPTLCRSRIPGNGRTLFNDWFAIDSGRLVWSANTVAMQRQHSPIVQYSVELQSGSSFRESHKVRFSNQHNNVSWNLLGLNYEEGAQGSETFRYITIPLWPLVLWRLILIARQRFRFAGPSPADPTASCVVCGYDLRATPARCPECGHRLRQ